MSLSINSNNLILNTDHEVIKGINEYHDINKTLFSESLDFCSILNDEMRYISRDFYSSLEESKNEEEVKSTFDKFNQKMVDIINKFITFLVKLADKCIDKIRVVFKKDSNLIYKYKDALVHNFESKYDFNYEKYVYTYITDVDFPSNKPLYDFKDYISEIKKYILDSTSNSLPVISKFDIKDDNFYNKFRYRILHNDSEGTIYSEDWKDELFNIYRNGGSKVNVSINEQEVKDTYKRFADYSNLIDSVKKTKEQLIFDYKKLESEIQNLLKIDNGRLSVSDINTDNSIKSNSIEYGRIENIIRDCIIKIHNTSNIHIMAFSAKLDAIIECYSEDKKVLIKAIKVMVSDGDYTDISENAFINSDTILETVRMKLSENYDKLSETTDYVYFLIKESNEQNSMLDFINKEILSESTVKFEVINETGAIGRVKNTINRVLQFLAKLWGKFTEFFSKVTKSDKAYLEKYKDIILSKRVDDVEVEMPDYDNNGAVRAITDMVIPHFNYQQLKSQLSNGDITLESYMNKEPFNKFYNNPDKSISENFVENYSGKSVKIRARSLNMTDLFNFIYGFNDKMIPKLKQELSDFQKQADAARKMIDENTVTESVNIVVDNKKSNISDLLEEYFGEDVSIDPDNKSKNIPNQKNNAANNIFTTEKETEQETKTRNEENENSIKNEKNSEDASKIIDVYFKAAQGLVQGKMNLAKKIYNDYYKIIRWHVQNHNTAKDKTTANKKPTEGTDFSLKDAIK